MRRAAPILHLAARLILTLSGLAMALLLCANSNADPSLSSAVLITLYITATIPTACTASNNHLKPAASRTSTLSARSGPEYACAGAQFLLGAAILAICPPYYEIPCVVSMAALCMILFLRLAERRELRTPGCRVAKCLRATAGILALLLSCLLLITLDNAVATARQSEWHTIKSSPRTAVLKDSSADHHGYETLNACINDLRDEYDRYPIYYIILPENDADNTIEVLSWTDTATCVKYHSYMKHNEMYKLLRSSDMNIVRPANVSGKETGILSR